MFNNGQMVAGGLIEGLLAQEAQLAATAQTLADAFITAFNAKMAELIIQMPEPVYVAPTVPLVDIPKQEDQTKILGGGGKNNQIINTKITVNAGVGTNGTQVGKQIVREVGKALKSGTAAQTVFGTGRLSAGML
jgi:hypothetical protein